MGKFRWTDKTIPCVECKKDFFPAVHNQIYCSKLCRRRVERRSPSQREIVWRKKYNQTYFKKRRAEDPVETRKKEREYRENNKEAFLKKEREWRAKNRGKVAQKISLRRMFGTAKVDLKAKKFLAIGMIGRKVLVGKLTDPEQIEQILTLINNGETHEAYKKYG